MTFESQEALLVWLIGFFGDNFRHRAILKGGMVLRLMDSPRSTNDVDFVFVPHGSRKEIIDEIRSALSSVEGLASTERMDSRALRLRISYGGQSAQVEITVAQECPSVAVSTAPVARRHGQSGHVVRIMTLPAALSHKLAAWNERRLWRDVHDLWFLHSVLGTSLELDILDKRLETVTPRRGKPFRMSRRELVEALRSTADAIDGDAVRAELGDTLPPSDLEGIEMRLAVAMKRLAEHLSSVSGDIP